MLKVADFFPSTAVGERRNIAGSSPEGNANRIRVCG